MHDVNGMLAMMERHGYALTFAVLLAEAVGLPFPGSIAMVAAGAAVASHTLSASASLLPALPRRLPPFDEPGDVHPPLG